MARAYASAVIQAPIEVVWPYMRDFNGLPRSTLRLPGQKSRTASTPMSSAASGLSIWPMAPISASG